MNKLVLFICAFLIIRAIPVDAQDNTGGETGFDALVSTPYYACASCHGWNGEGKPAKFAPPLGGFEALYIEKQMLDYANGRRGVEEQDPLGMQMTLVASAYSPAQIKQVSEIVARFPAPDLISDIPDLKLALKGKTKFENCAACHGEKGQGVAGMAPALTILSKDYLIRQLTNYKLGLRGFHEEDIDGQVMVEWVRQDLSEGGDIEALAAYVSTLRSVNKGEAP